MYRPWSRRTSEIPPVRRTSLSNLSCGIHELVIGAVDRAGNSAEATGEFNVNLDNSTFDTILARGFDSGRAGHRGGCRTTLCSEAQPMKSGLAHCRLGIPSWQCAWLDGPGPRCMTGIATIHWSNLR